MKTLPLDLLPEQLNEIRSILARHIPGREVWAFGSRVAGTAKPTSDLDLCIMGREPMPARQFEPLIAAFQDSHLPMKVDVVEWARLSPRFQSIIDAQRAVIADSAENI